MPHVGRRRTRHPTLMAVAATSRSWAPTSTPADVRSAHSLGVGASGQEVEVEHRNDGKDRLDEGLASGTVPHALLDGRRGAARRQ